MNGSAAAILGQKVVLGGGAPVAFHSLVWPSSSTIMAASISLASFLRSGAIDLGIAQPQMSSHANGSLRFGPSGKRAAAILPAILCLAGSLKVPHHSESATVKAASPPVKMALASLRSWAGMPRAEILWVVMASHPDSTVCCM